MDKSYQNYPTIPSRENPCASRYVSTCGDGCPIKGAPRGGTGCNCHLEAWNFSRWVAPGPCEACFATRWRWRGFRFVGGSGRDWDADRTTRANPQAETCLVIGSYGYSLKIPKHIDPSTSLKRLASHSTFFPWRKMVGLIHGAPWLRDFFAAKLVCQSGVCFGSSWQPFLVSGDAEWNEWNLAKVRKC